ncbi:hypothetical protein FHS18_001850 [Paenibacillus phyllosphaerae]|uniref:Uncharacterized protein n=1 Tax=Paenibacillus phyllosphaerae TaxID=274593 RepID=A0A7W5AWB2_9BACL|nr:hypothetical protein [Paenibacillus phyllosphaerae]MBB3109787.1 hypothetical protein [Paenibacillus phyllosphaerae]
MTDRKLDIETDGDERTRYEDTDRHDRTGFFVDDELSSDQVPDDTWVESANPSF